MELEEIAERTDRAMRTRMARSTAETIHTLVRSSPNALDALAGHRGWMRRSDDEFVCTFGTRSSTLNVPSTYDLEQLTRLITRIEVNVFLGGGADDLLLRELQALAGRELERLFDE
ncbi:MAG TPA: hypothetical protein VNI54_13965 [Thermoanaerobaculia bacterium]|nr:hypothetical protein [Thermoanaerobaculia bacterium]